MSEPINELRTAAEVIAKIPNHWRNAEIFLDGITGDPIPIRRISLQRTASGRRVVILHRDGLSLR